MTQISVELPNFNEPAGNDERIRWQNTTSGLIDATALRTLAGDAIVTRFQIFADQDSCQMQIVAQLGDTPGAANPSLSSEWELHIPAITIQAPGLSDLEISGPNAAGNDVLDTTEPYTWEPGPNVVYTGGLDQWVEDFKAAYALDTTLRATMLLDDGGSASHAVDAGAISWTFDLPQPSVTHVRAASAVEPTATSLPRAHVVTQLTNRLDLVALRELGFNDDETRRNLIRWNSERFAERPTFWLFEGESILTEAP